MGKEKTRVLLIAPHADDELFGAGATLLKWMKLGYETKIVLVACSDVYMHHLGRKLSADTRRREFLRVANEISTDSPSIYSLEDSRLDTLPISDLVSRLDEELSEFRPDIFLMPEPSYHQDHQYVNKACAAALRPTGRWRPMRVLEYEVPTSTWSGSRDPFVPNVYVDIDGLIDDKVRLFREIYSSQHTEDSRGSLAEAGMRRHAKYRGVEAGVDNAEAFRLLYERI